MAESQQELTESMSLKPSAQRASQLLSCIASIRTRITSVQTKNNLTKPVRLVAVSKLKPITDIIALASGEEASQNSAHQHFGENYVQELVEKSRLLPAELQGKVRWHFIGGLQSNKAQSLSRDVKGLWAVESVDTRKKANLLDKGREEHLAQSDGTEDGEGLRVFVQVNTSGEESKSGVEPQSAELLELCKHIASDKCPRLRLQGLMTIGAIARSKATTSETENEDFECLVKSRDWVVRELGDNGQGLEVSMGMSEDFEAAIRMGSDEVRVGSTIFGERPPKAEAKIVPDSGVEQDTA